MKCFTMTVDINTGAGIKEMCRDVQSLASKLDCFISFTFNGVDCEISPQDDLEALERNIRAGVALKKPDNTITVSSECIINSDEIEK